MAAIDTDGGHDEGPSNGAFDSSLPLKGVTICCTSIPDEKRVSPRLTIHILTNDNWATSADDEFCCEGAYGLNSC